MLRPLLIFILIYTTAPAMAQEYRSFDGTGNNIENPLFGATHTPMQQRTTNAFEDGFTIPAGSERPNPRLLSNRIFGQAESINDPLHLSDFCWVWGQFLDHDITLTPDSREPAFIRVPVGDRHFDPQHTGEKMIFMNRSMTMEGTGTAVGNPRRFPNEITAFIDASNVYGSDEERADYLRSFEGGKMRVSAGNLLPFNTLDGELESEIDSLAPHMDDAVGFFPKHFVAGDVRANENPLLLSFHTLFVREHNRLCDELAAEHPDWNDEELYQHARKIVGGEIQAIVYEQYLPAMGVHLGDYQGYKSHVDPAIFNVFAAAAFRLGHTLLNGNLRLMDVAGNDMPGGDLSLRNAFFNPMAVIENGGIDPFLKGMGAQIQQSMDNKMLDDVRNFLFGPPGAGGLDLAAININRGRERGLADFNTIRTDFGLEPYQFFIQVNSTPEVFVTLQYTYYNIELMDPWVGMLAEEPMPGALFGETLMTIMTEQFSNLRDGDRFYYENDSDLSAVEKQRIKMTRLVDIIRRNSNIDLMQENVFVAMPHEAICAPTDLSGQVQTIDGNNVTELEIFLKDSLEQTTSVFTNAAGTFQFPQVAKCEEQWIYPLKNDDPINGVSTFDIIIVLKHILGTEKMVNPYQLIAADANHSESITTGDLIAIRRIILQQLDVFPNNTSWRFVDADYVFPDPKDPFIEDFPERVKVAQMFNHNVQDFVGIKIGDVNGSVVPNANFAIADERESADLQLVTDDMSLEAGTSYRIPIQVAAVKNIVGYQMTLNYASDAIQINQLDGGKDFDGNNYHLMSDAVTVSWNGQMTNDELFYLSFTALQDGTLSEVLAINDRYIHSEAYVEVENSLSIEGIDLTFTPQQITEVALLQNTPNPFVETTTIAFEMPEAGIAQLEITDIIGKVMAMRSSEFTSGRHYFNFTKEELGQESGILNYRLIVDNQVFTKQMILVE